MGYRGHDETSISENGIGVENEENRVADHPEVRIDAGIRFGGIAVGQMAEAISDIDGGVAGQMKVKPCTDHIRKDEAVGLILRDDGNIMGAYAAHGINRQLFHDGVLVLEANPHTELVVILRIDDGVELRFEEKSQLAPVRFQKGEEVIQVDAQMTDEQDRLVIAFRNGIGTESRDEGRFREQTVESRDGSGTVVTAHGHAGREKNHAGQNENEKKTLMKFHGASLSFVEV